MARGPRPSLEELSAAIEAIHQAALDGSSWPDVLGVVGGFFRAAMVTLWAQDEGGVYHDIGGTERYGAATRAYAAHFVRLDMVHPVVARAPAGSIVTDGMVLPRRDLERTEFYADFADRHRLQYCMEARVTEGAEGDTYLTVTRSRQVGGFEAEDIRLLQLLLPHLRGAQRTGRRLAAATIEREGVLSALDVLSDGVLILDAGRRVLYANPSAEVILRAADGLVADHGFLRAVARADDAALRQALAGASAEGGRALAVGRPSGRLAFVVTVQPLITNHLPAGGVWQAARIPAAMVFVVDPEDRSGVAATHALRGAYGLTVAEAAAANAVARGLGAKDAARALNVAPSTLRWHLRQVFEKTGTERQAELASLVVRLGTIAASS